MNLEFSLGTVGLLLLGLLILALAIFFAYKAYLKGIQGKDLFEKYNDGSAAGFLKGRNKYPEADVLRNSAPFLGFGLVSALALSLLAFNFTQYEEEVVFDESVFELTDEVVEEEEIAPRSVPTRKTPPPPPPPPPPPIIEEVEDDVEIEEEEEIIDQEIDDDMEIDLNPDVTEVNAEGPPLEVKKPEPPKKKAPPPPPPPPPVEEEPEIFMRAEQMPRFPGCEDMDGDNRKKAACATKKMMKYFYSKVKYPSIAKENGVQGRAVLQFVVDEKGHIDQIKVVKDPGAGLGEAAKKVVESMNNMKEKWTPGMQGGKNVRVRFTLPVKFKLE